MTNEEAIKILKSKMDGSVDTSYEWAETVRMAIKALKQPEPHWVPCSERLPEKSGKYYVSGGDRVWICEFLIIPNFTSGWCNDPTNPMVQAWMPCNIPEPYREGEG